MPFPICPLLTVDSVIFIHHRIVLIRRKNPPFQGKWALPGGFVEVGETVENAAVRETLEETGLKVQLLSLLGVYSDPVRDPRGHTVSVVYIAKPLGGELRGADDAAEARLFSPDELPELAFDHGVIIRDAMEAGRKMGGVK